MTIKTISLGYWYPRTTLHLAEVHDYLRDGKSPLDLSADSLTTHRTKLRIKTITLQINNLEFLQIETEIGIRIKICEDGLTLLQKDHRAVKKDIKILTDYFETAFSPAINYLFGLGAPVPKELAGIKTVFPYFIVTEHTKPRDVVVLLDQLGNNDQDFEMTSEGVEIYRSDQYFILNPSAKFKNVDGLIEMLIFIKEFKGQLHHYLNLHRTIWEKIAEIKEQGKVRGRDVQDYRNQLESYKKTIELIEGRINQMGLYIDSRKAIISNNGWEAFLTTVLQFKYDNLRHALDYIKSQWTMTKQYVDSAIQIFNEINGQSTKNSVQALTVLTSLGLMNSIIYLLSTKQFPQFTITGLYYFALLIVGTFLINEFISYVFKVMRYKINTIELTKKFK